MAGEDGESNGNERRRRRDALRALAERATSQLAPASDERRAPSLGDALKQAPRRWPRWLIPTVSAVALLAVVALAVMHLLPSPAPKARLVPAELALDPETYGIACLEGAAWSPDSTKLAILGEEIQCGAPIPENYSYYPTVIKIVDTLTDKTLAQIMPDVTVQRDLGLHAPQNITPLNGVSNSGDLTQQGAFYEGIAWSPDGKRLALPFWVDVANKPLNATSAITRLAGMYVVNTDGTNAHAVGVNQDTLSQYVDEWNVKTLKPVLLATSPTNAETQNGSAQLYPVSLSYAWRPDGSLVGATPLNATSAPARPPLGPIGNPDGGASFTVWQPMGVGSDSGDPMHPVYPAPFEAQVSFLAWSPDGTYLLNASLGPLRLQPSKQPVLSSKTLTMYNLPMLPVRDAALDSAMNQLSNKGFGPRTQGAYAWRPDGKRMASMVGQGDGSVVVNILDCATGTTLTTINLSATSNADGNIQGIGMLWSPDGKRLLVESGTELYVLGPGKLPQG